MKIDECIINEKAMALIDEFICYDDIYAAETDPRAYAVATLGIVRGVLDMAGALKGELKNEQKNIR
ncbi:MAG: hypothetical protein V8Q42_11110 [Anaerovoracaceae bacterium]